MLDQYKSSVALWHALVFRNLQSFSAFGRSGNVQLGGNLHLVPRENAGAALQVAQQVERASDSAFMLV